jgi:hypothetical protein
MAQLVKRRVVNPTPPILALVNGSRTKRGKAMATRKRRRSTKRRRISAKRRNPVNPVNPARRRRRRSRRSTVYARRRNPINPTRRRRRIGRRRARRNPVTGVLGRAIPLVIGSAVIGATAPFTAQIVGRFAPQLLGNPIGVAATTFGTGWALSLLAGAFAFTRKWKDDVMLAGAVLAGGQLFTAYVAPMIPRLGGGQGGNGMGRRYPGRGMSGIGVMTGIPPGMAALPPMTNNQSMQGIGVMTGVPPGMPR